jgi:transcriptional regulator with XRE-family HTH domain
MKLSDWLKQSDVTITAFSERIGVTRSAVYSYLRKSKHDRNVPSPEVMIRISAATDGLVQPNDFYPDITIPTVLPRRASKSNSNRAGFSA